MLNGTGSYEFMLVTLRVVFIVQVFMDLQFAETISLRVSYKHQDPTICEEYGSHTYLIRGMPYPVYHPFASDIDMK